MRKLVHTIPGNQCLTHLANALVQLRLAQPGHEILPIERQCRVERRAFTGYIGIFAMRMRQIAPQFGGLRISLGRTREV